MKQNRGSEKTFPKGERLRGKKEFASLFKKGKVYSGDNLRLFVVRREEGIRKAGFLTGRKIKPAVLRNKSRRLLREAYRLNKKRFLGGYNLLVKVTAGYSMITFSQIEAEFLSLAKRAGIFKD